MNRDEILTKVRNNKNSPDEYELHVQLKAGKIAKAVGVAIAFLLVLIDEIWLGVPTIGWTALTIAFSMLAIEDWIVLIKAKRKNDWFSALFDTALLVGSVIALYCAIN